MLSGDAAIASRQKKSNAKTRSLTAEEIIMRDNAERTVEAARERQMALPPSERATREIAVDPRVRASNLDPSPEIDIIDKVLAGRSLINLKPKTGPKIEAMTGYAEAKGNQQQQKSAPVRSTAPVPVVKSIPVRSEVPVPVAAAVAKAAPVVSAVPLRPLPPKQAPPPPKPVARVVATPVPAPVVAPAAPAKVSTVDVQLKSDELELMAKSLQMLVKHRGGGPFGAGRLQTVKEIANLEISLVNTVEMLTRVDGKAASSSVVVPVKQASAPAPVAVRQAPIAVKEVKVAAPSPVPVRAVAPAPAPVGVAVAVATPVQARAVQTESRVQEDAAPITIAQGLDQFLLAPQLRSEEVTYFLQYFYTVLSQTGLYRILNLLFLVFILIFPTVIFPTEHLLVCLECT